MIFWQICHKNWNLHRDGVVGGLSLTCLAFDCHRHNRHHWQVFLLFIPHCKHWKHFKHCHNQHCKHRHPFIHFLSVLAGLTVARQISKILVYFIIFNFLEIAFVPTQIFLFCPWHKYFLFLPASHRLRVILRFSLSFQLQVLVEADTYKASILIWRISEQSQTCRERQIGMFYPHLKYFWPEWKYTLWVVSPGQRKPTNHIFYPPVCPFSPRSRTTQTTSGTGGGPNQPKKLTLTK